MRAKIEKMAAGNFAYQRPEVTFSDEELVLACSPGDCPEGSFLFSCDQVIKGILYPSSWRMSLKTPSFKGRTNRISYCFDSRGLCGGEVLEGSFCIVSEAGEFLLPYRVEIRDPEKKEESYAYFISADPIEPLPEKREEEVQSVVEIPGSGEEDSQESEEEKVAGMCASCIRNGRADKESFFWYRRGVELELKITNLYEYFMMAVPDSYKEALPRNLLLYFQMNNTLNNRQKAFLYANMIRYQDPNSDIYRAYEKSMEAFMLEQLLERKLNEDLAVIYERFLVESLLTIDFAEALADIMFLRRLKCSDPRIRQVQVLYEALQHRITIPLVGGQALIPVYTPGAVILLVDEQGNCYSSSVPYTIHKLMDEQRYVERCRELLRYHQGLYLHLCDGMSRSHVLTEDNVENYKRVLRIHGFTARYKQQVRQEILEFYYANHEIEDLEPEFFETETEYMTPKERAKFAELLILRGFYEKAWELVCQYGYALVRVQALVKLAVFKIRDLEYEKEDFLLGLCLFVFRNHKYNEGILEYLVGYYYGSAEMMEAIWKAGRAFELDVFDLEERLLSQMLFTETLRESAFEIFEDYEHLGGKGLISRAYLAYLSYQDFVREQEIPQKTSIYLEKGLAWEENLAEVCKLSYLKYLSGQGELNEHQRIRAVQLLKSFHIRKIRFGFMKTLFEKLGDPYLLEDKTFVEYRTDPSHKVVLHYVIETGREAHCSYVAERLYPMEPGVFVKEFTLFYGDRLTWFITEEKDDGSEYTTPNHSYVEGSEWELATGSKYAAIYEMARFQEEHDQQALEAGYEAYAKKQFLAEQLFRLK